MSKLSKRLEKLENIANPPKPIKYVQVIMKVGETREQAFSRAGVVEGDRVWLVRSVPAIPIIRKIIEVDKK